MSVQELSHQTKESWRTTALNDLGQLYCGQSPASSRVNTDGTGTLYVTGPEQWDGLKIRQDKWTTDPKRLVPDGCIFITVKGAGVGKIFPGIGCAIGRDVYAFKPKAGLSAKFIEHAIRYTVQDVLRHAVGDIPGLSKSHILQHEIGLPELAEQQRIVAEIEKQFSRLDEAVANLKRVKRNLKRYKAAVLKAAVEGKLTEDWRKQHPDVEPASKLLERILTMRRAKWNGNGKYKEPTKPDRKKLATLPETWTWTNIDQLAEVGTGATPKRGMSQYYLGGHIPWVTSSALNSKHVDKTNEFVTDAALRETNLTLYPPGTLLLAMYGEGRTRGKCSVLRIHATTNQAIAAIQCAEKVCDYIKLAIWSQYDELRETASGGVQPNLNLSRVRSITIPLPPLSDQECIVAEVERRLSIIDDLETAVGDNLKRAIRMRGAILEKAFTGRLIKPNRK
jgi:type I restriction enzyme, S subunit